jgi:hypothetical protein
MAPPNQVAAQYVYALAEGDYTSACALLDPRTRESLVRAMGSRVKCPRLFARCLRNRAARPTRDQSQLLYATVQVRMEGAKADSRLSGTPVARATREMTLANERGAWKLTSYGAAIRRCELRAERDRRLRHRRRSPHTRPA